MKVLVLGGNRYIGLHLVFELSRQGHEVTVLNSHPAPLPAGVRRLHGDRRQPGVIEALLGPLRDDFDAVFDNTSYTVSNLEPVAKLFRGRVRHFVFTSSIAVYLQSDAQPIDERSPVSADDGTSLFPGYGTAKVLCECLLREEHERHGMPATSLRVAHTCGPLSPLPTREPGFFQRLELGRPILIPGDGLAFIHVVHIQDVARAMCAVLGNENAPGQIYNVAGAQFSSILGYVNLLASAVGTPAKIVHVPADLARALPHPLIHWREWLHGGMLFSTVKARKELAWEPSFGLREALADAYRWFSEEGRARYMFDFSQDDRVLAELRERRHHAACDDTRT